MRLATIFISSLLTVLAPLTIANPLPDALAVAEPLPAPAILTCATPLIQTSAGLMCDEGAGVLKFQTAQPATADVIIELDLIITLSVVVEI